MNETQSLYQIDFELYPEFLFARIHSEVVTPEMVVGYLHEVTSKCSSLNRDKLMILREIPVTLSQADMYFTGTEFAHMGIERIKIAFIDKHAENREHLEFGMLVANNRGGHMELFSRFEEAEQWLLGEDELVH